MKKALVGILIVGVIGFSACSGKGAESQTTPAQATPTPVDPRLEGLVSHRTDSMEEMVKYLSQYGIPLSVFEKEYGNYMGFISIEPGILLSSGYDAEPAIDFSVKTVEYLQNEMVFTLSRSLIRQNSAGERELYYTGIVEARLSKDELYSYFERDFRGPPLTEAIKIIGTIIQQPK